MQAQLMDELSIARKLAKDCVEFVMGESRIRCNDEERRTLQDIGESNCQRVTGLDLYACKPALTQVPKELDQLKNLRSLSLNINDITQMKGVENLPALEELGLGSNRIDQIKGLDRLRNLRKLSLLTNKLTKIEGMENLQALEWIDLGNNRITSTRGLETLTNLRDVFLSRNRIAKLEGMASLRSLKHLDLEHNRLATLDGVRQLPVTTDIFVGGNALTPEACQVQAEKYPNHRIQCNPRRGV